MNAGSKVSKNKRFGRLRKVLAVALVSEMREFKLARIAQEAGIGGREPARDERLRISKKAFRDAFATAPSAPIRATKLLAMQVQPRRCSCGRDEGAWNV